MLSHKILTGLLISALLASCKTPGRVIQHENFPEFYKEGHRGARGLMPENTISSMIKAVEVGANVIEMDIFTSRDGKVIVAHDAYINRNFSLLPGGNEIPAADEKKYVLHQMDYEEIRKFDVGSKYYDAFPGQKKLVAHIPLLSELIDSVENYTTNRGLQPIIYNIELKTAITNDSAYNANPKELVNAVMQVIAEKKIGNRFYIQSFDVRPLQYIHQEHPGVSVGFLTGSDRSFEKNIEALGFRPHIYSPYFSLVNPGLIQKCRDQNIRVVPWTVNTVNDMKRMESMGVDGIITDYPDYLQAIN